MRQLPYCFFYPKLRMISIKNNWFIKWHEVTGFMFIYFFPFRMKTVADMEAVLMCGLLARRPNNVSVVLDSLDLAAVSGLRFQTRRTLIPASTQRGKTWTPFYSKWEILKCAILKITCLMWKCLFHLSISFKLTFFVLKYIMSLYFLFSYAALRVSSGK